MQPTRLCSLVIVLLCLGNRSGSAQVPQLPDKVEWKILISGSEAIDPEQCQKYLNELIAAFQKTFGLTDLQLKRLRVASKGAVEYSRPDPEKSPAGQAKIQRVWIKPNAAHAEQVSQNASAAARHPIWTRTVEKMLTPPQLTKARQLEADQRSRWQQQFAKRNRLHLGGRGFVLRADGLAIKQRDGAVQLEAIKVIDLLNLRAQPNQHPKP